MSLNRPTSLGAIQNNPPRFLAMFIGFCTKIIIIIKHSHVQVRLTPYDEQREAEQCLISAQKLTRCKRITSEASEQENNLSHCNFAVMKIGFPQNVSRSLFFFYWLSNCEKFLK